MKKTAVLIILLLLGFGYWRWTRSGAGQRKTPSGAQETAAVEVAQRIVEFEKISASITVDGRPEDWAEIPVLIEDGVGDTRPPDFKSLKMAMDDTSIYFLVEIVGWSQGESFRKVPVSVGPMKGDGLYQGICGTIYLDMDNLPTTGLRIRDKFSLHSKEKYGAEYKVDLPIHFYVKSPQVDFWLKSWDRTARDFLGQYVDVDTGPRNVAYGGNFMEFSIPVTLLAGSGKGHLLSVLYDDSSGLQAYGIAHRIALPVLVREGKAG